MMDIPIIIAILIVPYVVVAAAVLARGSKQSLKKDRSYRADVSVFLPTYNEEQIIRQKLSNLVEQTYTIKEILVYDCSTDRTPEIIAEMARQHPNIKLIRQEKRIGLARTINQSFKDAAGDIWVKTDCDSFIKSRDGLAELISNFADERVGGASGIDVKDTGVEKYYRQFLTRLQTLETNLDSIVIPHGALEAFRMNLISPIDPTSTADDVEQAFIVRKKGYRVIIDRNVVMEEDIPEDFGKRRSMKDRRAQGMVEVMIRNLDVFFNRKYGRFGTMVYPIEFFIAIVSPFILIAGGVLLSYQLYLVHNLLPIGFWAPVFALFGTKSNMLAAVIDTQLSSIVGLFQTMFSRKASMWDKAR
jgi:cellulose synthase/poly-beta-1,6-N-acetylglucosamine synthase-like glycosyltransferase